MGAVTFGVRGNQYGTSVTSAACADVLSAAATVAGTSGYVPMGCTADPVQTGFDVFLVNGNKVERWQIASIDAPSPTFNYEQGAAAFAFGFFVVIGFYVLGKKLGAVLGMLAR